MYIRTENGVEKLTDEEYTERFPEQIPTYVELRAAEYPSIGDQ